MFDPAAAQRADVFGDIAQLFGLYVRSEDVALARELDASIAAPLVPEESEALSEDEEEACPVCGAALSHDALACGDCGLSFG